MASQQVNGPVPEPDWVSIGADILRNSKRKLHAPQDWLEDVVQDALVCMVILENGGRRIKNSVAFGVAFVQRRWIDELRKRQRWREKLVPNMDEREARDELGTPDWSALLRQAGWEPTRTWSRILGAIANGAKGNRKVAEALGLHVKTVQESRRRLQLWLEKKDPPPPP